MVPRPAARLLLALAAIAPLLSACSQGRDIGRPETDASIGLGQTTKAEILAKYGPPLLQTAASSMTEQVPGGQVLSSMESTLVYGVAWLGPSHVVRGTIFGFRQGTLQGLFSVDNVAADQPDLDPARVERSFAGPAPTRAALVATFGPPQFRFLGMAATPTETDGWATFALRGLGTRSLPTHWVLARSLTVRLGADGRAASHSFNTDDSP